MLAAFQELVASSRSLGEVSRTAPTKSATCFRNNPARTHYAAYEAAWLPMGSGVTEAGCKLPVKKRLCGPGMSLGFTMAGHILRLHAPAHNTGQL